MNFNYPQFILIFFFNIYTNIFIFAHIYLPIVRISILCRETDAIANHHRVTIETFGRLVGKFNTSSLTILPPSSPREKLAP